ncbi:MAG: response regulator [bacterium]
MAKILIIDDELTIRELFRYIFEDAGYEVELAKNGRQALDMLQNGVPDFMILDVSMPEMSGTEFIQELKLLAEGDPRLGSIPFVVMTGESMGSAIGDIFVSAPGFVCFFPKMIPPEEVCEKVREVLASR